MAPILGIMASQISGHLWAPSGAYDSIATTTVGAGGSSSITFSSIPSTYTHLEVRVLARSTSTANNCYLTINSDTGSNYTQHQLYGDGASAGAGGGTLTTPSNVSNFHFPNSSQLASTFGGGVMTILDYANTSKNKTLRTLTGVDLNGTPGYIILRSTLWNSTSAITSLTFTPDGGSNFAQYTSFALYGIRGN